MRENAAIFYRRATVAGYRLKYDQPAPWLTRYGHCDPFLADLPKTTMSALKRIFSELGGDEALLKAKTRGAMSLDFVRLPSGQVVEYDETAHFTRARVETLRLYPRGAPLGYEPRLYLDTCEHWWRRAERAYAHKVAAEFPGPLSRARQRAYFDAVRDLCAPHYTGLPLVRVHAPERDPAIAFERFKAAAEKPRSSQRTRIRDL